MNARKTFLMALLLAGATAYLLKVTLPGRDRAADEKMAFSKLEEAQIAKIEIERRPLAGGEERFSLEHNGAWSLSGTRGAVLDATALNQFLTGLRGLSVEGPLEESTRGDATVYGLDRPVLTTVVHERSDRSTELAFGKKNEYLSARYLKVSGRAGVFMVDDGVFQTLDKSKSDIRSKTPFSFKEDDVRRIVLSSSQGQFEIEQPAVGEWKIVSPNVFPASTDDVGALLRGIQGITVGEFIDGAIERRNDYGFGLPRSDITIKFREGIEPNEVKITLASLRSSDKSEAQMYLLASTSDTIFKLSKDPSPELVKRVQDLREKLIVNLPVASIATIKATGTGVSPITIASAGATWKVNDKESDPVFVEQLLKDIGSLKAVDFPESVPEDAFKDPFLTLTMTLSDRDKTSDSEKTVVSLTVGKEIPSKEIAPKEDAAGAADLTRYAKSSKSDTVYAIRDVEAKRIAPHEEALIARTTPTAGQESGPVTSGSGAIK